jgi:hypothetical protein
MRTAIVERYVVCRNNNVVYVDFEREPDPPAPTFPGAGSLRFSDAVDDLGEGRGLQMATAKAA